MSRAPRPLASGLTYHVTSRGNGRRATFRDDADRRAFLAGLGLIVAERGWSVPTHCLMPNHVHLVVRTPEPDLSDGMRELLGRYAVAFNLRHERVGHLFGARFHSRVVTRDAHHLELFRYLALNPVRAGLCTDPAAHRWSAHAALLGLVAPPPFLDLALGPFDGDRTRYAAFVAAAGPCPLSDLLGDGSPERLRAARDAGWTQREMARALGISQQAVSARLRRCER